MKRLNVRLLLSAMFIVGIAPSQLGMAPSPVALASSSAPAQAQAIPPARAPESPAPAPEYVLRVDAASVDPALDRSPQLANALVTNASHPGWATRYGTEAGAQLLAPRLPTTPDATQGATPALTGTWRTSSAFPFAQNITAIAYGTDGRLFAGVANVGLRVYGPDVSGIYRYSQSKVENAHLRE